MEIVKTVANSVDPMIKFTVDYPSNYKDGRMPILDVKASINEKNQNHIEYEFYEKPTRNKKVIQSDSAIPAKQMRTILTQEGLRRMRNTQIGLGKKVQEKHMNEYMIKLKRSGFKVKFRKQIVDCVFKAFGEKPLFRGKNWNKESRKLEKEYKRKNWYKNSPKNEIQYTTVLFVPVTKGAKLLKEVKRREEEVNRFSKDRVKFWEDGGVRLKDLLTEKDPFPTSKCDRKRGKKCFL